MPGAKPRKTSDPEKTRRSILAAAVKLFSERGFAGTSMGDIAAEAKVPKSLVQYHHVTKEGLWAAALEEAAKPLIDLARTYAGKGGKPDVEALLSTRFNLLKENPRLYRLLLWLSLERMPIPEGPAQIIPRVLENLAASLRSEPARVRHVFMLLVCAMDGWFLHRETFAPLVEGATDPAERDDAFLAYLLQVAKDEVVMLREA